LHPGAALPGGEISIAGEDLGPREGEALTTEVSGVAALVTLARPTRATIRIPEGTLPGEVIVRRGSSVSAGRHVSVAVAMAENLHPVASPAVDAYGNVYTTLSGSRGQQTPVSIFRIAPAPEGVIHELRPFVREILNPTGLAFGPDGRLYVSSRADGTIYRIDEARIDAAGIDAGGDAQIWAEGLGIATGIAFDREGNLYVGDRSGTIFKIRPAHRDVPQETFVFATLEPSISAYHLAFSSDGTLYVTGPTTASSQSIHAIDRDGTKRVFFHGLGRAQGLAFDAEDNLYVAASYRGERGIVRITPAGEAELVVSGPDLIGLCFLPESGAGLRAALATREAIFEVRLAVEAQPRAKA
jgi:sugar lactone lactonase YvrE